MKKLFGYLIVGIVSFAGGAAAGWIARKKTAEVQFEEVSAEEQAAQIAADLGVKEPIDIETAINMAFGVEGLKGASEAKEKQSAGGDFDGDNDVLMDTQKINYMKKWKAEEASERYDTRTTDLPKDIVTSDEEDEYDPDAGIDKELLEQMTRTAAPVRMKNGPDIEAGTMEDWDHWLGESDGEYDPIEIWWFDEDNVLTDSEGDPLENPGKYMGFDVEKQFDLIDESTTGDPDIRVIYNHRENAIFQIVRKHMSYDRKTRMEEFGDDDGEDEQEWIHARHE